MAVKKNHYAKASRTIKAVKKSDTSNMENAAEALWKDQSEDSWVKFSKALEKSDAKYYKIFYETLKNSEDLTKSFARLYDSKMRPIAKIPIIRRKGKSIEGATIYLKNLKIANIF